MQHLITVYPSIFSGRGTSRGTALKHDFTIHSRIVHKQDAGGFGPYVLHTPEEACLRHGLVPIDHPHRCDACVKELTLAVFDVDCGTLEEIAECEEALAREGCEYLFYSTYSYHPEQERPSLRLIVPLSTPVAAERWKSWRSQFISRFRVPADLDKCSAPSHFYYRPSIPASATWEPVILHSEGPAFDSTSIVATARSVVAPNPKVLEDADLSPMSEEKLTEWRRLLEKKQRRLSRGRPEDREKGEILRRLLAGEALAEHGSRNHTSTRAAALVLAGWHEGTIGGAMALFASSLAAMQAAGSRLDESTLLRQLSSAFTKVSASRARRAELDAQLEALLRDYYL